MRPRRLSGISYVGCRRYFLTFCTFERRRHFADEAVVTVVHEQILRSANDFDFAILAYCYMPDHLHMLAEGISDAADLCTFVALGKQHAAFRARQLIRGRLWQHGYFERVLRDEDDTFNVARYVVQNPVRAGLARSPEEYRFTGSSILTKEQLIGSCMWRPR